MKLRRAVWIEPLLLFLFALIGGTLWLLKPVSDAAALVGPAAPPAAAPPPVLVPRAESPQPRAQPNLAAVRAELEAAEQAMRERAAALDTQTAEIEMLQRRVDALRAEFESLEARHASVGPVATAPAAEESYLQDLVKERQAETSHLESELASLKSALAAPAPDTRRVPRAVRTSQKLPVLVDLNGNRIAPVTAEFFHFPMFGRSAEIVAARKKPGETIAEARAPDSQFARFLSKIHPDSRYISCLLNSDSFEAFYAVRDMASRAGFDIAWEPADTSSGKIAIQKVKLVANPRSPRDVVPMPDIMRGAGEH
jgi:hypothetical protein